MDPAIHDLHIIQFKYDLFFIEINHDKNILAGTRKDLVS